LGVQGALNPFAESSSAQLAGRARTLLDACAVAPYAPFVRRAGELLDPAAEASDAVSAISALRFMDVMHDALLSLSPQSELSFDGMRQASG
jgi:hypothetical protein